MSCPDCTEPPTYHDECLREIELLKAENSALSEQVAKLKEIVIRRQDLELELRRENSALKAQVGKARDAYDALDELIRVYRRGTWKGPSEAHFKRLAKAREWRLSDAARAAEQEGV